jgi:uncharacterized glyoxalase superfamily protein PhnB
MLRLAARGKSELDEEVSMKPTPPGWPRISSAVFYDDAAGAIDWLVKAFGFSVRLKVPGEAGRIEHSELEFGEGLIMVASLGGRGRDWPKSPASVGGANTQALFAYVDDVDAHCDRARSHGAVIVEEPKNTDHGPEYWEDRSYLCRDPGGHYWWFGQRIKTHGAK